MFSQHNALVVTKSSASTGQDLISKIPVQVIYADIEMFSLAFWYGPPAFRIPVGGKYAIPAPPRQQANNYPGTYDDQDSNLQASCQPFFRILDNLTDFRYQARAYDTCFTSRINYMKATEYPIKQVLPGNPLNNAGNIIALKVTLWRYYLRPFGYGETKLTLPFSTLKSTRSGFSSFLRFDNSPYLGHNGLYADRTEGLAVRLRLVRLHQRRSDTLPVHPAGAHRQRAR